MDGFDDEDDGLFSLNDDDGEYEIKVKKIEVLRI